MTIHAFKMQLKPGVTEEYRRRHDEIWPELSALLTESGIYDYSIFLDGQTLSLFAVLKLRDDHQRDSLPSHPVMQALMPHAAAYGIEPGHLLAVIDGCQMDLEQTRYLDFAGLSRYCHLVAGVVGEVAARIFGQTQPQTTAYAHQLGLAFQLTNIIRDVGEDAMRGRIYLPVNELQQFDVKAHEILNRQHSERFVALMRFQAERAQRLYGEALALLPAEDYRAQKPGLMMASIYRTLLTEIEADDFQVLHQRISLTPLRKLWLAWKVQALGRL